MTGYDRSPDNNPSDQAHTVSSHDQLANRQHSATDAIRQAETIGRLDEVSSQVDEHQPPSSFQDQQSSLHSVLGTPRVGTPLSNHTGRDSLGEQASVVGDYDDLLVGLDMDEMNDFDGLDDFGDGAADGGFGESKAPTEPFRRPDAISLSTTMPENIALPTAGFATGRGKAIAPPSDAAIARVRKLFDDVEDEKAEDTSSLPLLSQVNVKRRRIDPPAVNPQPQTEGAYALEIGISRPSLFATAGGTAVALPSHDAMTTARDLFAIADDRCLSSTSLFATAAGAAPPPMSAAGQASVKVLLDSNGISPSEASVTASPLGFTLGSGRAALPPSAASLARARAMFADLDDNDTASAAGPSHPHQALATATNETPVRPLGFSAPIPRLATSLRPQSPIPSALTHPVQAPQNSTGPSDLYSTPARVPLRTTTNTYSQADGTPTHKPPSKLIEIKTPAPIRRIGLGGTPASRGKGRKPFNTPFKKPSTTAHKSTLSTGRTSGLHTSQPVTAAREHDIQQPVFDLVAPPDRMSWKQAYLHPQYTTSTEMREMGIPDEIWTLNLSNAMSYQFIAEDASIRNNVNALALLKADGCRLVTSKWVDNHWSMILWKLAGVIQAKPGLFQELWQWGEVVNQLKYRYEREFGLAQRPIIRRIQEHDSSSSLPMVLCVSDIHYSPVAKDEKAQSTATKPYLELTDGWYRINAEVDDCLARAITRGVIRVGGKLAVSGAKLENSGDGEDVLEAFDKSRLVISGNSCSLARWHTRLGVQAIPFVAGLSSLSTDGGIIMLMEIIVEKIFPVAFMSAEKGVRDGPWNEDEESIRQDRWKERYEAESTRLRDGMQKRLERIQDLTDALSSHASELVRTGETSPPSNVDNQFELLLTSTNISVQLRSMPDAHICHLAEHASQRLQAEIRDGQSEIEADLQALCPSREVRDFRMVRFLDAREGKKEAARVGMLNVWDVNSLEEGLLQEGRRYLVSNIMPSRNGDWSLPTPKPVKAEIYLNTRRDTRWKTISDR